MLLRDEFEYFDMEIYYFDLICVGSIDQVRKTGGFFFGCFVCVCVTVWGGGGDPLSSSREALENIRIFYLERELVRSLHVGIFAGISP